jgi:hypothetical protein
MRRVLLGVLLALSFFAVVGVASTGAHMSTRQWAIVSFREPVLIRGSVLMGRYLVVHDDERMAKGEPCTSIYVFDKETGPKSLEVEFMCVPKQKALTDKTTFQVRRHPGIEIPQVIEYQFAGDEEAHGVPAR